jgi:hydroxymethylbilane synthase
MVNIINKIVIGTRGSSLALKQTEMVIAALAKAMPDLQTEMRIIKTTGDIEATKPIHEIGGKAVFSREIDKAMLDYQIDIAVHSLKDLPGILEDDICIAAVLKREDAHDSLIGVKSFAELKEGANVGTSSPRRKAQILKIRPDLNVTEIRGNVQTRIDKAMRGEVDATLLANAGLIRLGLNEHLNTLSKDEFVPAIGQGVIAITCLKTNAYACELVQCINHTFSFFAAEIERKILIEFGGDCYSPVSANAEISGDTVTLRSFVASECGTKSEYFCDKVATFEALEFAEKQGKKLRSVFDDFAN